MKKSLVIILFICTTILKAQEKELQLIALDSTWAKEVFPFPINFAREIPYQGFEEARFPPKGWSDEHHPNFWSYTFAWSIRLTKPITANELEKNLKLYFDGLSNQNEFETTASIIKIKQEKNKIFFKGNLTIFDNFKTKKPLLLNVLIESRICEKEKKSVILFKFSPKEFSHQTWQLLKKIRLAKPFCK